MPDAEITAPIPVVDGERVRPARLARFAASLLIVGTAGVGALALWQSWRSYWLVRDVHSVVPTVTAADLDWAADVTIALSWAWLVGSALSGVAFLAWLWRARVNSARVCLQPQRLRIRWAVLAWVVPGMNLWRPQMVVSDVWRASDPERRGTWVVGAWWGFFLTTHAVDLVGRYLVPDDGSVRAFRDVVVTNAVSAGTCAAAAALVLALMWRVDRWQSGRLALR